MVYLASAGTPPDGISPTLGMIHRATALPAGRNTSRKSWPFLGASNPMRVLLNGVMRAVNVELKVREQLELIGRLEEVERLLGTENEGDRSWG